MPIDVISYLQPANDNPNFGVASDIDLTGGWRSVADIAERDAIFTGRRLEGMYVYVRDVDQVWRLEANLTDWSLVTNDVISDADQIYVDPTGDDSASGASGDPIATIEELTRRIKPKGLTRVWLSAGNHELSAYDGAADTYENRTVIAGEKVYIRGTVNVLESFDVASVSNNVITAQGSPGWTIDEHAGKWMRWLIWGAGWPDFNYGWRIISNTADTLTCAATFGAPGLGSVVPAPTAGTTLQISEHSTKILRPVSSDSFTNYLNYDGRVIFQDIVFDGDTRSSKSGTQGWTAAATGEHYWCEFLTQTNSAIFTPGDAVVIGCYFKSSGNAIEAQSSLIANGDNFFEGCTVCFFRGGSINHGSYYGWYKDCNRVFRCNGDLLDDGSVGYWINNCDNLIDGGGFVKTNGPMVGFDAANRDLNNNVVQMTSSYAEVTLYDSSSITIGPDVGFFLFGPTELSLTDYIAAGADVEFPKGNRVSG